MNIYHLDIDGILEAYKELCGNKELIINYYYDRDGGHGDIVNVCFVMLTYNGECPYYIVNGEFTKEESKDGLECALLYYDTDLKQTLIDLYNQIKKALNK